MNPHSSEHLYFVKICLDSEGNQMVKANSINQMQSILRSWLVDQFNL